MDDFESLNLHDLDIEMLEQRLELAAMIMPLHCSNNTCNGFQSGSCSGNSCTAFAG